MEFFVAQAIAKEILKDSNEILGSIPLPIEVRGFLVDFLIDNPPELKFKTWLTKAKENLVLRNNLLSLIPRLRIPTETDLYGDLLDEDTKIASKFVEGNFEAFEVLYNQYKSSLLSYLRRNNCPSDVAEDIVIDSFLSIMQRKELIEVANIRGYLLKVAKNKMLDYYRKNSRPTISIDSEEFNEEELGYVLPNLEFEEKELGLQRTLELREAIENLTYDEKLFVDLIIQDYSMTEISKLLDIDRHRIYYRRKIIMEKLKQSYTNE